MAGKVLSIEVGYSITHVIETDYEAKNPKIYNAFSFETPLGVLSDEGVTVNDSLIALMRQAMAQNGIRTTKAVFTISSTRIAIRDVSIPLVKDNKIKQLLLANSKEYFPVDLSQYELVYRVAERLKEEKQIKLTVFAVPRALIESYQNLAKAWGLTIVGMDYSGNSIYQVMQRTMNPAFSVTLRVDDNSSMLTIIKDGKVELQRTIGYGIDEAVEVVRSCKALGGNNTYTDAMELMRKRTCLNRQLRMESAMTDSEDIEEPAIMDIRDDATRSLTMLIGNVSRVMDYYTTRNQGVSIEKMYVVGLGADCSGLSKLLTNELGIKVVSLQELKNVNFNRSVNDGRFKIAEYMTCIGATFAPLNFMFETAKEKSGEKESGSMIVPVFLFCACVITSVLLLLFGAIGNRIIETENIGLQAQIDAKRVVVEQYNEYLTKKVTRDGVVTMDALTMENNSGFLNFLSQMEEKMPSDLLISSLVANSEGITMSVTTSSKETAAEAIMQLRTFTGVGNIQCSGVSEELDDNNIPTEYFDITVNYFPADILETEENAESEAPADDVSTDEETYSAEE